MRQLKKDGFATQGLLFVTDLNSKEALMIHNKEGDIFNKETEDEQPSERLGDSK